MRWLALDVGSRVVGVATCDPEERVATTLPAVRFAGPERLAAEVERLVAEWGAGGVVVGVPVTRSGQGRGERRVVGVVAELRRRLKVPIELEDERGTTRAAEELLAQAGVPRRRWPELVDSLAARLILEGRLARKPEGKAPQFRDGAD
jgi:putative holliday junction resolvase